MGPSANRDDKLSWGRRTQSDDASSFLGPAQKPLSLRQRGEEGQELRTPLGWDPSSLSHCGLSLPPQLPGLSGSDSIVPSLASAAAELVSWGDPSACFLLKDTHSERLPLTPTEHSWGSPSAVGAPHGSLRVDVCAGQAEGGARAGLCALDEDQTNKGKSTLRSWQNTYPSPSESLDQESPGPLPVLSLRGTRSFERGMSLLLTSLGPRPPGLRRFCWRGA